MDNQQKTGEEIDDKQVNPYLEELSTDGELIAPAINNSSVGFIIAGPVIGGPITSLSLHNFHKYGNVYGDRP